MTKKEFKKQFKVYESQKSLLRKINYESAKPKKRRQKSLEGLDGENEDYGH